jgi:hypothetical protein
MIRALVIALIVVFAANIWPQDTANLIFDMPCNDSLPVHFRKSSGEFLASAENVPDTTGLALLNASGSAEFCLRSLEVMLKNIGRDKITIVDLRQESHGFVNGLCVSWDGLANTGLSREEIEADETRRLDSLFKVKNISVNQIPLVVGSVQTEKELARKYNAGYYRIPVTDRRKPQNEDADRFIKFVNSLGNDTWLHFHCHAGYGRTTTFLAMYDMMRNSRKVSLQDILQRQHLLGGINLARIEESPGVDKKDARELKEFLIDFYSYCRANSDNFGTLFSVWIANRKG